MKSLFETLRTAARQWRAAPNPLQDRIVEAARSLEGRLRAATARAQAPRAAPFVADTAVSQTTWMTLVRPTLVGDMPSPLRRVAEPVVAVVAVGVLASLASIAVTSLAGFLAACLLAMAILTQVFGLSLDIDLPRPQNA